LNFTVAYDFIVINTFRKKKISFSYFEHSSQIDFIFTRKEERLNCIDYKIIPDKCVVS
jgi:hypothetical protein